MREQAREQSSCCLAQIPRNSDLDRLLVRFGLTLMSGRNGWEIKFGCENIQERIVQPAAQARDECRCEFGLHAFCKHSESLGRSPQRALS